MASDNIFSGLKVGDFASFIAGPGAAVFLSDFGADVIKVEPPGEDHWKNVHKLGMAVLRYVTMNQGISRPR